MALYSYALYLVHKPIMDAMERTRLPVVLAMVSGVAFAFAYAIVMRLLVEAPLGKLRKRLQERDEGASSPTRVAMVPGEVIEAR